MILRPIPVLAPVTSTAFTVAAGDSLAGACANAAMETVKESIAVAVRMSLFMADYRLLFVANNLAHRARWQHAAIAQDRGRDQRDQQAHREHLDEGHGHAIERVLVHGRERFRIRDGLVQFGS